MSFVTVNSSPLFTATESGPALGHFHLSEAVVRVCPPEPHPSEAGGSASSRAAFLRFTVARLEKDACAIRHGNGRTVCLARAVRHRGGEAGGEEGDGGGFWHSERRPGDVEGGRPLWGQGSPAAVIGHGTRHRLATEKPIATGCRNRKRVRRSWKPAKTPSGQGKLRSGYRDCATGFHPAIPPPVLAAAPAALPDAHRWHSECPGRTR
jgi:hypothetical protein